MLTNWTDTSARIKSPLAKDVIFLALAIVILNALDACSTLYAVNLLGATEINIVMAWAIERGHTFFMLIKLSLASICTLGLVFATTGPSTKKISKTALIVLFIVYLLIVIWQTLLTVALF